MSNKTCGFHTVNAGLALEWLVWKLKETYLGPGPDALLEQVIARLERDRGDNQIEALKERAEELDREVNRLVVAVRKLDVPELIGELNATREERDRVRLDLAKAERLRTRRRVGSRGPANRGRAS